MGIFRKSSQSLAAVAVYDLFTDSERERVDAPWRLTALPRDEFDATYGGMLVRCWRYVAAPEGECWTALKSESLTRAVAALRVRQAHVLPRFAAAEDAARLAEVMSFALAAAVVAERFGQLAGRATAKTWCPLTSDVPASETLDDRPVPCCYCALLLPRLVGAAGLVWLGQELVALAERDRDRLRRWPERTPGDRPGGGTPCRTGARTRCGTRRHAPGSGGGGRRGLKTRATRRRRSRLTRVAEKAPGGAGSTGCATACGTGRWS